MVIPPLSASARVEREVPRHPSKPSTPGAGLFRQRRGALVDLGRPLHRDHPRVLNDVFRRVLVLEQGPDKPANPRLVTGELLDESGWLTGKRIR
jgi:hypothetical protein